jgi:hypothetical protein
LHTTRRSNLERNPNNSKPCYCPKLCNLSSRRVWSSPLRKIYHDALIEDQITHEAQLNCEFVGIFYHSQEGSAGRKYFLLRFQLEQAPSRELCTYLLRCRKFAQIVVKSKNYFNCPLRWLYTYGINIERMLWGFLLIIQRGILCKTDWFILSQLKFITKFSAYDVRNQKCWLHNFVCVSY